MKRSVLLGDWKKPLGRTDGPGWNFCFYRAATLATAHSHPSESKQLVDTNQACRAASATVETAPAAGLAGLARAAAGRAQPRILSVKRGQTLVVISSRWRIMAFCGTSSL